MRKAAEAFENIFVPVADLFEVPYMSEQDTTSALPGNVPDPAVIRIDVSVAFENVDVGYGELAEPVRYVT